MYLPVIMINRFGWWGFIAFAVPNVLGCAAFGYIVKNRQRSEAMIAKNAAAMTWFSIITVAYHMFFLVWLFVELVPIADMHWAPPTIAAIVLAIGAVMSFLPNRDWLWLSAAVYALSLSALWWIGLDSLSHISWSGEMPTSSLLWLTPTLFFGFLLCPYLDLTFHRAIQNSPSPHAFAVFGITFAIMLLLTCALWFNAPGQFAGGAVATIALAHILAQSTFTVGAHLREIRLSRAIADRMIRWVAMLAPLFAAPLLYLARDLAGASGELNVGENLYLRILVFYGLIFPAYVLIVVIAARRFNAPARAFYAAAVLACLPLYEFGFIGGRTWLLAPALGGLMVATLLAKRLRATCPGAKTS